jgi:hypothetical protein
VITPEDQFWIAAPSPSTEPSRSVRSWNVTLRAFGWISKSRSMPIASALFSGGVPPSITVPAITFPRIVSGSMTSKSPVSGLSSLMTGIPSWYTPEPANSMMSAPGRAFASRIAARSVHLLPPKEPVLQTPSPGFMSAWSTVLSTTMIGLGGAGAASAGCKPKTAVHAIARPKSERARRRRRVRPPPSEGE